MFYYKCLTGYHKKIKLNMEAIIIFLCGVLSGLVALLLGYFIRMGLLHNREIKSLRVDLDSAFRLIEEKEENLYKEIEMLRRCLDEKGDDFHKEIVNLKRCCDDDFQNLHSRISNVNKEVDESIKYTDKRIDKVLEKLTTSKN